MNLDEQMSIKTVLITGASSGIGAGVAKAFAMNGARVAINFPTERERNAAQAVLGEISHNGGEGLLIKADVRDEAQVKGMVGEVTNAFGQLDVLINNAGVAKASLIEDTSLEDWQRTIDTHLKGTFLCTRAVLPNMYSRNFGKIINTASQLAYKGAPAFSDYTAAKGGIISFTRSLALEIGDRAVNANCVAPGATTTPMLEDVPDKVLEEIRSQIPKGALARVDDIVGSYLFLASEMASHYQGQCLSPNGGDVFL
ncbi:MAG: SDR family NAD(P)-dependent oxidoreductase [Gammaproteobacteria bacterium]